jgi:Zn-dependent metalloprotease
MKNRLQYLLVLLSVGLGLVFVGTGCCSFNGRRECPVAEQATLPVDQAFTIALKTFQRETHADLEKQVITIKRNNKSKHWMFSFDVQPSGPGSEYTVFVFDDGTTKVLPGM